MSIIIHRFPNEETHQENVLVSVHESIVYGGAPGELKHLITRSKRKKTTDSLSSGERKGKSLNPCIAICVGVKGSRNYDSRRAE